MKFKKMLALALCSAVLSAGGAHAQSGKLLQKGLNRAARHSNAGTRCMQDVSITGSFLNGSRGLLNPQTPSESVAQQAIEQAVKKSFPLDVSEKEMFLHAVLTHEITLYKQILEHYLPNAPYAGKVEATRAATYYAKRLSDYHRFQQIVSDTQQLRNLQIRTVSNVPFSKLIPADAGLIYIGEDHTNYTVFEQTKKILRAVRKANPHRAIYFVSESVNQTAPFMGGADRWEQIAPHINGNPASEELVEKAVVEHQMKVVGLENPAQSEETIRMLVQARVPPQQMHTLYAIKSSSFNYLFRRNSDWAKIIKRVRAQDPDGLIIVHAGSGHLFYSAALSVPAMVQEPHQFVIGFLDGRLNKAGQQELDAINYFWRVWTAVAGPSKQPFRIGLFPERKQADVFGANLLIDLNQKP